MRIEEGRPNGARTRRSKQQPPSRIEALQKNEEKSRSIGFQ
jgi:hypothetical protein